jgi:hypothetical protein
MVSVRFDSEEEMHRATIFLLDGSGNGFTIDKNGNGRQIIISETQCELLRSNNIEFKIIN